MNKQWILIVFLILILVVSIEMGLQRQSPEVGSPEDDQVCIKDRYFSVEIAANQSQRTYGLINRKHLDSDRGILFVFEEEGYHFFWMKNTLIPLGYLDKLRPENCLHREECQLCSGNKRGTDYAITVAKTTECSSYFAFFICLHDTLRAKLCVPIKLVLSLSSILYIYD